MTPLSSRLSAIVAALPLHPGIRVLEIGGGSGAAARAVAGRIGDGQVLMIDRSAKSIALARERSRAEIEAGRLRLRQVAVEAFVLLEGDAPFDLAFAIRVGVLDGRHPGKHAVALRRISRALAPHGRLFIDGGDPLRELQLPRYRPLER